MCVCVCVGVLDHRVLSNRARAYLAVDQLEEALADAEISCELRPFWAKVCVIICNRIRACSGQLPLQVYIM